MQQLYGKYVVEISDLVNQMTDEPDDFQYDRNFLKPKQNLWYNQTHIYFERKFGNSAIIINYIFWIILVMLAIFIIGIIVGYIGVMTGLIK
ncbi:hypothetical protein [Riemerella columbina]|uniref:hypothetical protein n=1 Tax=Riemerella columbina TaxID=103810 RepID=UPI000377D75C|nr:hypothetical protein [Riemerella columbina]